MFDIIPLDQLLDLLKSESGHGIVNSLLLFLILLRSGGIKKEISSLKEALTHLDIKNEVRIGHLEHDFKSLDLRLAFVEKH